MPNQGINENMAMEAVAGTRARNRMSEQQIERLCSVIMASQMSDEIKQQLIERLRSGDASVVQDIMAGSGGYPDTPLVFGPEVKFKLGVIAAIKRFKKKKTHNRTSLERLEGMRELARDLSMVYGLRSVTKVSAVCLVEDETADSRGSFYHKKTNTIVMVEKLSIITFLHEFAHALGKDEVGAVRWSLTLFKRVWPQQFERLVPEGHTLVMPRGEVEDPDEVNEHAVATPEVQQSSDDEDSEALALMEEDDADDEFNEDEEDWLDEEFGEDEEDEPEPPKPVKRRKPKARPKMPKTTAKPKKKSAAKPKAKAKKKAS